MDNDIAYAGRDRIASALAATRPVLIAVPFYKNERLVPLVIESLIDCAADIAAIGGYVVLYDDSPTHAPLAEALATILPRAQQRFPCRLERNSSNIGFVRTMNKAVAEAVAGECDLLMLNSDTRLQPGALREMVRVLNADPTIAFVNPRSNNATIATLPVTSRLTGLPPHTHRAAYAALARMLPDISYVPTAVGFCMLIGWQILAEFGGFDEAYGHGYNEENDLVMRVSRCGYRVALANRAFVWHEGEASFKCADIARDRWERRNRAILDQRYPEYRGFTAAHDDAPETVAERLLAMLIPDASGKLDIALDFSSFREAHNGTYLAGRQLLDGALKTWQERFNIHVICTQRVYDFHGYASLGVPRSDPHDQKTFAAIFRVGQPYDWDAIRRTFTRSAVIGVYMLDTISIDCPQLSSAFLYNMWQFVLDGADVVATQSRTTQDSFRRRFHIGKTTIEVVAHHSLDLSEYRRHATGTPPAPGGRCCLLILGNHFQHKYLAPTAAALAHAFPDREVIALGQTKPEPGRPAESQPAPGLPDTPNLTGHKLGALADAEMSDFYARAKLVVFPSHAEGFGFPVLDALAAARPIFVRNLPVFKELWEQLDRNPNIHFFQTTADLITQLRNPPEWIEFTPTQPGQNGTIRAARQIGAALEDAISDANFHRIATRIRNMQFADSASREARHQAQLRTIEAEAAHLLATRMERLAKSAFQIKPVYSLARTVFRAARATRRLHRY
jgi:GT2 family glycosyltransferase